MCKEWNRVAGDYRVSGIDIQGPAYPQAVLLLGTEFSSRRRCILVGLVSACLENGPQRDGLGICRIVKLWKVWCATRCLRQGS